MSFFKRPNGKIPTLLQHSAIDFVTAIRCTGVSKFWRSAGVMSPYILGIDVGTTSIKAILLEKGSRAVVASHTLPTEADVVDNSGIKVSTLTRPNLWPAPACQMCDVDVSLLSSMAPQAKEQQTSRIIDALNRCVTLLPRDKLENVSSIGLSGQMHGVLFWKAKSGKTRCFLWEGRVVRHLAGLRLELLLNLSC